MVPQEIDWPALGNPPPAQQEQRCKECAACYQLALQALTAWGICAQSACLLMAATNTSGHAPDWLAMTAPPHFLSSTCTTSSPQSLRAA